MQSAFQTFSHSCTENQKINGDFLLRWRRDLLPIQGDGLQLGANQPDNALRHPICQILWLLA